MLQNLKIKLPNGSAIPLLGTDSIGYQINIWGLLVSKWYSKAKVRMREKTIRKENNDSVTTKGRGKKN